MNYCIPAYYFVMLPVTAVLYQLCPKKMRWGVLLAMSYAFFWLISHKLIIWILFSTVVIHWIGLWLTALQTERNTKTKGLERSERKAIKAAYVTKQRGVLALGVLLELGVLLVLKYSSFFGTNFNALLDLFKLPFSVPVPKFGLPIGISFYTMQAVSYLFDVYHEVIPADRNLGRLALFLAFFPTLMEGPMARYSEVSDTICAGESITWHNLTYGAQRMLFGYAKKFLIADRLNALVKTVFTAFNPVGGAITTQYSGGLVALAAVCYTVQLYMEFSGTMDVVIGSAEIFGIKLPENFRQPFFSKSISDFWTRWHITLGTWFKNYIFYPVSLSKPLKKLTSNARKKLGNHFGPLCASSIALLCVWVANGLWHGSAWHYLFFGIYHFIFILLANITEPFSQKLLSKMHIEREKGPWHVWRVVRTVIIVCVGEMFFRADTMTAGIAMFQRLMSGIGLGFVRDGTLAGCGMDVKDAVVVVLSVAFVLVIDILHEKGVVVRDRVAEQKAPVRWALYLALVLIVLIFGAYGMHYAAVDQIYAGF